MNRKSEIWKQWASVRSALKGWAFSQDKVAASRVEQAKRLLPSLKGQAYLDASAEIDAVEFAISRKEL